MVMFWRAILHSRKRTLPACFSHNCRPAKKGGRLSQGGKPAKQRRVIKSEEEEEDEGLEDSEPSGDDSGSEFDARE